MKSGFAEYRQKLDQVAGQEEKDTLGEDVIERLEVSSSLCCADEKGLWRMRKGKSQCNLEFPGKDF